MDVEIKHQILRLESSQVIGSGGEGTIFLANVAGQAVAIKIYHTPIPWRQAKLRAFLAKTWQIAPDRIALPLYEVHEPGQNELIGFSMPYLGTGSTELAALANKKQRASLSVSTREIAELFLDGARTLADLHRQGLVAGDLSDQNILYNTGKMLWIDVDAWQFASYPCPVGTEDFLAPELYDQDLSLKPLFTPEHDWYSFTVHLFRSLLLAHPYGGSHPTLPTLMQRARQRVFVFDAAVTYPRVAYPPSLLDEGLREIFTRIFAQGWRGPFPIEVLQRYRDSLITCPTCQASYPRKSAPCPFCQARVLSVAPQEQTSILVTEMLRTPGKFVFSTVQRETIYALAYEHQSAILYSKRQGEPARRLPLFEALPGATYALSQHILIVNPAGTQQLLLLDISGEQTRPLTQLETEFFAGTQQAMFHTSQEHILMIQNRALIDGSYVDDEWQGRPLRSVMEKQTWFTAANQTRDARPAIFGYFQVLSQQMYWLISGRAVYDVALPALDETEALQDLAVYFSANDLLVRRQTRQRGIDYLRTEILDYQGQILFTAPRLKRTAHPHPHLHGMAYQAGTLLHATDVGIVQEKVEHGTYKTFAATAPYVHEGDTLELYGFGLLVIGEDRVVYLVL